MPVRSDHYWLGNLAMTVALAAQATDPKPILKPVLKDFLRDYPRGTTIGDHLRLTLKEYA